MRFRLGAAAVTICFVTSATFANTVIDTIQDYEGTLASYYGTAAGNFGLDTEPNEARPRVAETFQVGSDNQVTSFSFLVGNLNGQNDVTFQGALRQVTFDPVTGEPTFVGPDLYRSGDVTKNPTSGYGVSFQQEVTFTPASPVTLTPGLIYAIYLDAVSGTFGTVAAYQDNYAGGDTYESTATDSDTFNVAGEGYDLVFNITLVPEPTSAAAAMVGCASMLFWRKRR